MYLYLFLAIPLLIFLVIYQIYRITKQFYHPHYPPFLRGGIPVGVDAEDMVPIEGYDTKRGGKGVSVKVRSWMPETKNGNAILFIHGWESSMGYFKDHIRHYLSQGFLVIGVDGVSHGESDYCDILSLVNMADSIETARKWMLSKYKVNKVVLWGHSLGGVGSTIGVGTGLIGKIDTLVIEGIFSDSQYIIKRYLNSSPLPNFISKSFLWMMRKVFLSTLPKGHRMKNLKDLSVFNPSYQLENIHVPYILVHAVGDHVVSYSEFEEMIKVKNPLLVPISLEKGNHFTTQDYPGYFERIDSALNNALSVNPTLHST